MKRVLALLLSVAMLIGMMPTVLAAETEQTDATTVLAAEEVSDVSRLDESTSGGERPVADSVQYDDDEIVTVIVQLDAPALLDYYDMASYAADEDATAGESVSNFLSSEMAQEAEEELKAEQEDVIAEIESLQPSTYSLRNTGSSVEVLAQWTSVVNAMSIRIPYGQLEAVKALDGVYNAYVQVTYERPDEPTTDAGEIAGYSYDMVGLSEVWTEGYTGKGMLVAVLDTGLALNWAAYANNEEDVAVTGNSHITAVHEAFTENSFKSADAKDSLRYTDSSLARFLKTVSLNAEHLWLTDDDGNSVPGTEVTYDYNALWKNSKVPFAYDYADFDVNVYPSDSDHGTHVSGTILGYAETEEGEVTFSGIAPDAQLMMMKVFGTSGGATDTSIICALEDAAKLGADVMNLSLGSTNGFSEDDTAANDVYDALYNAGILFMISAGNESYSSAYNNYDDDYGLAADPDISMIASPSVYSSAMSVASINSTVDVYSYLTWTDAEGTKHEVAFNDPNDVAMTYKFAGQGEFTIVPVGGTGTYDDYYAAGFRSYYGYGEKGVSGIALVQRGEISFADKINNASNFTWSYYDSAAGQYVTSNPVQAVIVYDNVDGELITMSVDGTSLTSAFISKADGEAIVEAIESGYEVKITVHDDQKLTSWSQAGEMSSFTSWGATPSLELKPDITAPGGNIWSTIVGTSSTTDGITDSYGMMSGTSMAAPHMTGITALVEQYVQTKGLVSKKADASLTEKLLVSTAIPQEESEGVYYSPRRQGAGLVNAAAAITTPAYISVEGQNVGKIELYDDPDETGEYELTFKVNNLTNKQLTYAGEIVLMRPDTTDAETGETLMVTSDIVIKTVELDTITVPANGSVTVNGVVSLTDAEKEEIKELFPNGTYMEGYVILTSDGDAPQIGLPFLGFFGDWTSAPILDRVNWTDDVEDILDADYTWGPNILGYYDGYNFSNLGQNPFDPSAGEEQMSFKEENITLAPGTGYFQEINDYILYQLRDSKVMVAEVRDAETNELYYRDWATYQVRSYYDSSYGYVLPCSALYGFTDTNWDGTDLDGNVLPSGTECIYTIYAYGDGDYPTVYNESAGRYVTDVESIIPGENEPTFNGHAMDMTGDTLSFKVMVDTDAPTLVNNAVTIYEEDGHVYLTGTFVDNGSIASIEVAPVVKRWAKGRPETAQTTYVQADDFYVEYIYDADVQEYTFKADVTNYVHNDQSGYDFYMYEYEWTGAVYIFGGDYGGNDRTYAVQVKDGDEFNTGSGLVLSQTSALLHPGSEFDLSVVNNTDDDAEITRVSSDPSVATVDEYGHVVAIAPGQTTITVSNGTETAYCIVAVEATPTEVLDFNLSVESFDGLKPEGSLVVKVTDLYPADVELTSIRWEVSEDDETAEYYEGLINCAQYSSDGLQGEVYLNYSAYDQYDEGEEPIPGGSGTLTVTLNGVSRSMDLSWEDLYKTTSDEDLISDLYGGEQAVFVTQGETATLIAKYNDSAAHSVSDVKLYTAENYVQYSYDNTTDAATGLVLDGPNFCGISSTWTGTIVNTEGYALPENIRVFYRYDYGYEYELPNSWRTDYTYDKATGEIVVNYTPANESCQLVIRADGVESEGKPAGATSGKSYTKPDGLYGSFNWTVTNGEGELKTFENELNGGYTEKNGAYFTPSEPGVSYITATSKDGNYSVNFVVVSEPVKADTLTLEANSLTLTSGEEATIEATLSPEPSLEKDEELIWTSFNTKVATVDKDGNVTAKSAGYAFIKVATKADTSVQSYCVVEVKAKTEPIVRPATPVETPDEDETEDTEETENTIFEDVPSDHWASDEINAVAAAGLFTGTTKTTFAPDAITTRGQLVTVLWRLMEQPDAEQSSSFEDVVRESTYAAAVDWGYENGIVEGVSETRFNPNGEITRQQLAAFLWRLAGRPTVENASLSDFVDGETVSAYAQNAMLWATSVGVFKGTTGGYLKPTEKADRATVAVVMYRYMNLGK